MNSPRSITSSSRFRRNPERCVAAPSSMKEIWGPGMGASRINCACISRREKEAGEGPSARDHSHGYPRWDTA